MKKLSLFLVLISVSFLFIFSCKKEKDDVAGVDYGSNNGLRTTVTGIVLDESNDPLSGVTVTAYGQTTSTNQYGIFVFKNINVNKTRCVLIFTKTGFFNRLHGFIASANTVNYTRVILISNAASRTLSASAGGIVNLADGSSVLFQPNSFITSSGSAYTGTVNIAIKHLSPDDANFGFMIPGNDLLGKNLNNEDVALYTYGMLGVELTGGNGTALQLANGKTAILTFTIASSQLSSAPATIPLWYFDETASLWKEEGSANKVGNNYVGTVIHFSWWNCDLGGPSSPLIKGSVIDCNGVPVPNVVVNVSWATTITNQNGEWQGQVPSGITLIAQVLTSNNPGILSSQMENIPALSNNQIFIVSDLLIPCPSRIAGILKKCTGENTEGFISISDNGSFYNYQYTLNGLFNLISIPNSLLNLEAYNQNASYYESITSLSSPNTLYLDNLVLCDTSNFNGNYFILNGGPFSNQLFKIITNYATAKQDSSPFYFSIKGFSASSFEIHEQLFLPDTLIGTHDWLYGGFWSSVLIQMNDSVNYYEIHSTVNGGFTNVTEIGLIGSKVKGAYFGDATIAGNNLPLTQITLSGSFDVNRLQ